MSEIVEKTLGSLQSFLGRERSQRWSSGTRELVEAISASSLPQMEGVFKKEMNWLRKQLSTPQLRLSRVKECLSRALYCELMGFEVPFAYIHAIKLAQQGSLLEKRAGYLAATVFLHPSHELSYLIIGTIQKDLKSSNPLEVCLGLNAIPRLIGPDTAPALMALVLEKTAHCEDFVRKKVFLALRHLVRQMQEKSATVLIAQKVLWAGLGDVDLGVVSASLGLLLDLIQEDAFPVRDLGRMCTPLCQVLGQIIQHKVPPDLVRQGVPAPWTQILLLKILAKVGKHCKGKEVPDVLVEVLKCAGTSCGVAVAVLCECVDTAMALEAIKPDALVAVVAPLLRTVDPNVKYMAVKTLGPLFVHASKSALSDELRPSVVEGLSSGDESVRTGTLKLLYQLADPTNVQVICAKMLDFLSNSRKLEGQNTRTVVAADVFDLAYKFHPNRKWYMDTVLSVSLVAPEALTQESEKQFMSSLRKDKSLGSESKESDKIKLYAVDETMKTLRKTTGKNPQLLKLALRIAGEFWEQSCNLKTEELWDFMKTQTKSNLRDRDIMSNLLLAARRILTRHGSAMEDPHPVLEILESCSVSEFPEVRQAAKEIINLACAAETRFDLQLKEISKDTLHDWTMTFLDSAVLDALERGATPYDRSTKYQDNAKQNVSKTNLQFGPYEGPLTKVDESTADILPDNELNEGCLVTVDSDVGLNLAGVKKVWSKEGRVDETVEMENNRCEIKNVVKDDKMKLIDELFGDT